MLAQIMATPMIQCDQAQWTLWGISLAGFNAIISIVGALGIATWWRGR
jgi:disulfide bond formation protein DsbB